MSWRRIAESFQALLAHALLFSCTLLLAFKLDHSVLYSWWIVFAPLWFFHAVVARGRFSLPAPTLPHDRYWAPWHAVMAIPLLVAFELLLCIHLVSGDVVNLKIAFIPLLVFEIAILIDNVRMCKALMPGEDETISDEIIWKTLPHFWVAISMVFFIAATIFTLLKLSGNAASLGWWDLFINFGIAECFAFLVFTKWYNPIIHGNAFREPNTRSRTIRNLDWSSGSMVSSDEDQHQSELCNLQDLGGHLIKVLIIIFQILLFMRLEGTPSSARHIPWRILFIPLYLIQGIGVIFTTHRLVEKIVLLFRGSTSHRYFLISSKAHEFFGFLHHGSRLLGWWSIDEVSREEQAKLYCGGSSGYKTFSPEAVKQMPKSNLIDEIWRLQAALSEQTEITKFSQQEHERLQNEKILCRICFAEEINVVLLPCRHHILCSTCSEKCTRCPICRESIERGMLVHDVYSLDTPVGGTSNSELHASGNSAP